MNFNISKYYIFYKSNYKAFRIFIKVFYSYVLKCSLRRTHSTSKYITINNFIFNKSKYTSLISSEYDSVMPSELHTALASLVPNMVYSGTKLFFQFGRIINNNHCVVNEAKCCTIGCYNLKYFRVSIRVVYNYAFKNLLRITHSTSKHTTSNSVILQLK